MKGIIASEIKPARSEFSFKSTLSKSSGTIVDTSAQAMRIPPNGGSGVKEPMYGVQLNLFMTKVSSLRYNDIDCFCAIGAEMDNCR
jgi:hypothetical protein